MTEPRQDRTVSGLAPRRPQVTGDLSRLQAKNRTPVPPPPSSSTPPATPPRPTAPTDENAGKKRITVYIDNEIFSRARGVHKATAHLEDDRSWSQFIEKALLREAEARERSHNDGKRYRGSDTPLSPGRPLSS